MPLFNSRKSKSVDYKARLEHKLYLARENPEAVFDLSQCNLKSVPPGTYSLCKVYRKEALYLQENVLTTLNGGGHMQDLLLIQIINLACNNLSSLPDDIEHLKNLKLLNVSHNQLKYLPEAIGSLRSLEYLDVSSNQLVELTSAVGNLHHLLELNLRENSKLKKLPVALCHARSMREVLVDVECLQFPPREVTTRGTGAIMAFLAKEFGMEYELHPVHATDGLASSPTATTSRALDDNSRLQAKIMQLEKLKEMRQHDRLAMTQEMDEHQQRELAVHAALKKSKDRLLDDLLSQEVKLGDKILKVHQEHESDRTRLIDNLLDVEQSANHVVSQLLALRQNTLQNNHEQLSLLERERLAEEELLNSVHQQYESLRRKDVLHAMEAMLEDEYRCEQKLREYEEGRAITTRTLLSQEVDNDSQLGALLMHQDAAQTELLNRIQRDEELQRAAVGALLERGDARSWGLVQQVSLVETQLAALTAVEMSRKKLQTDEQMSELCDQRVALSQLLVDLLEQQMDRRRELIKTMEEMERRRRTHDSGRDFWLRQYQRLLDSKPGTIADMERNLNPLLAQGLLMAGVIHCLPFLAQSLQSTDSLEVLTEETLQEMGVCLEEDRKAILDTIGQYLQEKSRERSEAAPSAPSMDLALQERTECVVCMEKHCEIVFVPCGHMCCCTTCAETLLVCPMCRAHLQQKIRAIVS